MLGVLAVAVLPFAAIYLLTTKLSGSVLAWLGRDVFFGTVIVLLVISMLVALGALIYGFSAERRSRRVYSARRGGRGR